VFADKVELFNGLIQRVCTLVDHQLDHSHHSITHSQLRRVRSDVGQTHCLNSACLRRCDTQYIAEEDASLCMELGSTSGDEYRPLFLVGDEEPKSEQNN